MYRLIPLLLLAFVACSEDESEPWDPANDPDPYAEFYWLVTNPDWPIGTIDGDYSARHAGGDGFFLTPDSLIYYGAPNRYSWAITIKRSGAEVWLQTKDEGRTYTIRGVFSGDELAGKYIKRNPKSVPQYGPIEPVTFQKAK